MQRHLQPVGQGPIGQNMILDYINAGFRKHPALIYATVDTRLSLWQLQIFFRVQKSDVLRRNTDEIYKKCSRMTPLDVVYTL
jgi:hypothetical protein